MAERKNERRGLGRGLSALMADIGVDASAAPEEPTASGNALRDMPIELILANPNQPRRVFDDSSLDDLAKSIREKGIVQPLVVRPSVTTPGSYEIVAGERRWRAAQKTQLSRLPVIVRDFNDLEVLEVAIIENIQREGLNAIDEALGYQQLIERFGHTQEKISEALGKSRSHIANTLRLLKLPDDVRSMVAHGRLSAGHARALVTAENPTELALKVVGQGLSVRETEALARQVQSATQSSPRQSPGKDADTRALEDELSAALGLPVSIEHKDGGNAGRVSIRYRTLNELDQICQLINSIR